MRTGVLRHRADFRSPVQASNGQSDAGAITYPAITVTLRCEVKSITGVERLGPGQEIVTAEQQMLTVRRSPLVSVKQRVDVTYADSGQTVPYMVQRVERADGVGEALSVYCTAVES